MVEVVKSAIFDWWLRKLKDRRAAARVQVRIDRLVAGTPGDVEPVGGGISELRVAYGPGCRVYYLQEGRRLIVLLCGGDKVQPAEGHRGSRLSVPKFEDRSGREATASVVRGHRSSLAPLVVAPSRFEMRRGQLAAV